MGQKLLENLNTEQKQAVIHTNGSLLIVAGAGTGKTTVITRRIAYLVEQKLAKPEQILALTFTEKAAGEMQERADILMELGYYDSWISTFHSFCERILKNHALEIGLPDDFKLLNDISAWVFVKQNFDKFDFDYYRPMGNPNKFIEALLTHFSRCKDETISPQEYLSYAQNLRLNTDMPTKSVKTAEPGIDEAEISRIEEIASGYHTYQKLLADNNFLDFGDLICYTLELFKKRPKILSYYQEHFKYLMVDEFQDTNYAQYQLVKLLSGDKKNICVVGDDDQSIYKFRGASVSNILKFKEDFPNFKQVTLVENYRSEQNILDLAYNFIQANNPDRLETKLGIDKRLKSPKKGSRVGLIEVIEGKTLADELNAVADKILFLKNSKENKNSTWNDFAILLRSNSSAEPLLPILSAKNIPYIFLASTGLYKKPVVSSLINYLKFLERFYDHMSFYSVISMPQFEIPAEDIARIVEFSIKKTLPLFDAFFKFAEIPEISFDGHKKISSLSSLIKKHSETKKNKTASEMFILIVRDLMIEKLISEDTLQNSQTRENIEQFYKEIEHFESENEDKSLNHFLKLLNLRMEAGDQGNIKTDPDLGPEALKVLTVHSSKGLEFEYVFVINMVDQRFPTRKKSEGIELPKELIKDILPEGDFHLQEERRLFYVAITRAKSGIFFSWAKDYGGARGKKPSVFLEETNLVPSEKASKATGKVVFKPETKNASVKYTELPKQFSYTKINDFFDCPLKFKYHHYLKLPLPGSPHFSFGNSIHKTFEIFLKEHQKKSAIKQADLFGSLKSEISDLNFKHLEKLYEKYWVDEWYADQKQKNQYFDLGKHMLKYFFEDFAVKKPKVSFLEQFFKLPVGEYFLVGKIDRIDEGKDGIKIIDYKTGKKPEKKASKDISQLYIYQLAAEEFLKKKVESMEYWYLKENERDVIPIATREELFELKTEIGKKIETIIDTIRFDRFKEIDKTIPGHKCEFDIFI